MHNFHQVNRVLFCNLHLTDSFYEKLALKVEKKPAVSVGDCVMPVNPVCTVYGDYRNQLSVRCDDVVVATTTGKDKA